jgi:hypothetical protein
VRDITGAQTAPVLYEYVNLWEKLKNMQLNPMESDRFVWRWTPNGQYSASLAYHAYFVGMTSMAGAKDVWMAVVPPKVKCFF